QYWAGQRLLTKTTKPKTRVEAPTLRGNSRSNRSSTLLMKPSVRRIRWLSISVLGRTWQAIRLEAGRRKLGLWRRSQSPYRGRELSKRRHRKSLGGKWTGRECYRRRQMTTTITAPPHHEARAGRLSSASNARRR